MFCYKYIFDNIEVRAVYLMLTQSFYSWQVRDFTWSGIAYKNRRCGKIVHETATDQVTLEFKLLQVPLLPSTMNQSPYHNGSCKRPQNTKCETIHKTQEST